MSKFIQTVEYLINSLKFIGKLREKSVKYKYNLNKKRNNIENCYKIKAIKISDSRLSHHYIFKDISLI